MTEYVWLVWCKSWNGDAYDYDVSGVYTDKATAEARAKQWQGKRSIADVEYTLMDRALCRETA